MLRTSSAMGRKSSHAAIRPSSDKNSMSTGHPVGFAGYLGKTLIVVVILRQFIRIQIDKALDNMQIIVVWLRLRRAN